jgi:hypothetical protein
LAQLDPKGFKVLKDLQVHKGFKVLKDQLDLRVVQQDRQDHLVRIQLFLVLQALQAHKVQMEQLVRIQLFPVRPVQ